MFRTELQVAASPHKIQLNDRVFSFGSCFAIHIGQLLHEYKFATLTNPFGTIFNPASLFQLLEISIKRPGLPSWSFLENQGVHRNYLFHSDLSGQEKSELQQKIAAKIDQANEFLLKADFLLLTFGTSLCYRLKSNDEIVANCHKVPASEFSKEMLTAQAIIDRFKEIYQFIKSENSGVKFILTVSPVRHIKDTLELNSVSKAVLRTACEALRNGFNDVHYFPSYEIMMDDLRDYRFYNEDLIHPNVQAIKYVWGKFKLAYLDDEALRFTHQWEKIKKAIEHRPFFPGSTEHKSFIRKTIESIEQLNRPNLDSEIELLKKQLNA